jgi:exopolysaccharide production protein ExoQ
MTPLLALVSCLACIVWLLHRDTKERASVSAESWIVTVWVVIYASRPVTSWFVEASKTVTAESFDEGNPIEALVNLVLIVAAVLVLWRRRVGVGEVLGQNAWLAVVYLFWFQSIMWSDDPIITLKRLVKDVGNIAMVLVVLSDKCPAETIRAVCVRCAYVCVPLSVVLVRYFPELGRTYTGYNSNQLSFIGVTANKNTLGMLVMVAVIIVLWDLLQLRGTRRTPAEQLTTVARLLVLAAGWYLLRIADSATSLVCAAGGSVLLLALGLPSLRGRPGRVEVWGASAAVILFALNSALGLKKAFIEGLGRDMSLTTRTDIWPVLLQLQDSPVIGAGFSTFWSGHRLHQIERELGNILIQAHNGYLDTYLNGGLIGVGLLVTLLGLSYWRIRERLALGTPDARIRFTLLFVAIAHNYTEATFYKLSLLWFVTVYAIVDYRKPEVLEGPGPSPERRVAEKLV